MAPRSMALLKALLLLAFSIVGIGGPLVTSDLNYFSPRTTPCDPENMEVDVVSPQSDI